MKDTGIYIPSIKEPFSYGIVKKWYMNIVGELNADFLAHSECQYLTEYYKKGGLLRKWRRPYFFHHFGRAFTRATQHLSVNKLPCRILDLGCGMGTQSLLFAFLGADVIGLDSNQEALSIFEKRKSFYEKISSTKLKIRIIDADALSFNYKSISPINCVFSMFAFNMIQPSSELIAKLSEIAKTNAHLAIQDVNTASWKGRIVKHLRKSCAISPKELRAELSRNDWRIIDQQGGISILPIFWRVFPNNVLRIIDDMLSSTLFFPLSYLTLAKRELPQC